MEEKAIDYFEKNKGKMSEREMVRSLRKQGISEHVIEEAREAVFGRSVFGPTPAEHDSLLNFYDKKIYTNVAQKITDFFLGVFGLSIPLYIFVFLDHFIGFILAWALFLFQIFCIFYFWNRRKYLSVGCLVSTIFTPILLFVIFLWYWS